jgi:recombinational DNA repair ATPase RecF
MRQTYEQNIDQNYKPELSYEECLRIVKGMEAVRKCHLINSPIVERAARLMQHQRIHYLPALNHFIEDMAAKVLKDTEQSSAIVEHPKPI